MILVLVEVVKNLKNVVVKKDKIFKIQAHGFITLTLKDVSQYTQIDLFDEIIIEPIINKKKVILNIEGKYSKNTPNNNLNVIYKAINQFYDLYHTQTGFNVKIIKNIPKNSGFYIEESHYAKTILFLHNFFSIPLEIEKYKNLNAKTIKIINFYKNKKDIYKENLFNLPKEQEVIFFPEYIITEEIIKENNNKEYFYKLNDFKKYFSNIFIFENKNYNLVFSRFFDVYKKFKFLLKKNPYAIALSDNSTSLLVYQKIPEEINKMTLQII
jgi:hypothetical protein